MTFSDSPGPRRQPVGGRSEAMDIPVALPHPLRPMAQSGSKSSSDSAAHLGFAAKLWLPADKLRNNMDAAGYKHVVLGQIFLKGDSHFAGKTG